MSKDDDATTSRLSVTKHRDLIGRQRAIVARIEASPDAGALFFINPVLALKDVGVDLSPEMADHVLRALRHPQAQATRRTELETSLRKALGEEPQPNDAKWLARTLFQKLHVKPLATEGHQPAYVDPAAADAALIASMRPKIPKLETPTAVPVHGTSVQLAPYRPTVRRIDLGAPVPALAPAKHVPAEVSLETLWFYKDANATARDLLELGVIAKSALPVHSGDSYRRIKDGTKPNAFKSWITSVRFAPK